MAELENMHWVEQVAARIEKMKKEPYVVNAGITTSGPTHLGTLCEFLYPSAISEFLGRRKKVKFYFEIDDMDAFDSVPASLAKYGKELEPHLGKPLAHSPDPEKCHGSVSEHFFADLEAAMKTFGVRPEVLKVHELYAEGKYDKYAFLFFERIDDVRKIVAETSLRKELPEWWSPIMPVCAKCGRIATTRVVSFDGESGEYEYACDRDVKYAKGCGFSGSAKISDHEYKITWRLDWPSRQDFLNVSAEGGGVDHFTRGGSWDTAVAVHEKIFKKEPPIGYKFGFVLFGGKKYSKSKGVGLGLTELLELMPPELIKYALLVRDIQENKDIDVGGDGMLRLYEDYLGAAKLADAKGLSRTDRKRRMAFALSTKEAKFSVFSDVLLHYMLYRDWKEVGKHVDAGSARYLADYIQHWVGRGLVPEEYSFEYAPAKVAGEQKAVKAFALALDAKMTAIDIHNLVFNVAKENGIQPSKLFEMLYETLINKPRGPKMGRLMSAVGVEKVKEDLLGLCE